MDITILIATFFKVGNIKKAPGTWGSLAGLVLGVVILFLIGNYIYLELQDLLCQASGFGCAHVGDYAGQPRRLLSLQLLKFEIYTPSWLEQALIIELTICFILFLIGTKFSSNYVKKFGREDPKEVVIDEVVGQLLALFSNFYIMHKLIVISTSVELWIICFLGSFVLFRLFDILKPWPINFIDSRVKGGLGIMLDDILAAIFSSFTFILLLLIYLDRLKS